MDVAPVVLHTTNLALLGPSAMSPLVVLVENGLTIEDLSTSRFWTLQSSFLVVTVCIRLFGLAVLALMRMCVSGLGERQETSPA